MDLCAGKNQLNNGRDNENNSIAKFQARSFPSLRIAGETNNGGLLSCITRPLFVIWLMTSNNSTALANRPVIRVVQKSILSSMALPPWGVSFRSFTVKTGK
jgi:hypothetical protein